MRVREDSRVFRGLGLRVYLKPELGPGQIGVWECRASGLLRGFGLGAFGGKGV